jgi:5-methylcytosine-specific restriction enzyme subunit McrC
MHPALITEIGSPISIHLNEWDTVGPDRESRLKGISFHGDTASQRIIASLGPRVGIREEYSGLHINSGSYVGRVDIGPLRIAIYPKLPVMPLTRLFRYAYGLRDLAVIHNTSTPIIRGGIEDLMVAMLYAEAAELLHRGLAQRYVSLEADLSSPRGQILVNRLICHGGVVEARLPCRYFERRANWLLNQVFLGGLHLASRVAQDVELKRRIHRLAAMFGDVEWRGSLSAEEIQQAGHGLTRLTEAYRPALTLIRLLQDSMGASLEKGAESIKTHGFLFDMNLFFQNLMARFLGDYLATKAITEQGNIRDLYFYPSGGNPKKRIPPKPRPDFALFSQGRLLAFLDAKYRDVWERGYSTDWLYQLSMYALASPNRTSVLLYASMSVDAADERVEVRAPVEWSAEGRATVIIRPVPLTSLASLLENKTTREAELRQLADSLVAV